jgi:hypothetical protein
VVSFVLVVCLSGCARHPSTSNEPSSSTSRSDDALLFMSYRGRVTTPAGRPVADAAINSICIRPLGSRCLTTLVGYSSRADGTFYDNNPVGAGIYAISAYKPGFTGRRVVLALTKTHRPYVHLVLTPR